MAIFFSISLCKNWCDKTKQEIIDYISQQKLNINNTEQNLELLIRCEVTSLTIALNYLGYNANKLIINNLFQKNKYSYGANAPILVKTANDYLSQINSEHKAYDISGTDFIDLLMYINDGYPVIIWENTNIAESCQSIKLAIDNELIQWYANLRCMVLIGYTNNKYIIADPLKNGISYYDKEIFEQRYNELKKQAIVIY